VDIETLFRDFQTPMTIRIGTRISSPGIMSKIAEALIKVLSYLPPTLHRPSMIPPMKPIRPINPPNPVMILPVKKFPNAGDTRDGVVPGLVWEMELISAGIPLNSIPNPIKINGSAMRATIVKIEGM